ncbi:AraC family transcriptional regulator [Fulvivirga sp. RKSG066]|uniref:helix-turn-helix domain-containing protein n=1 Tax=Fulvivirga aurantia TaxID=2529383 RepID=UPI0012BCBCC8|nr:helix-turn-helix domain-containing protein [Fulvivirga aurantia]MTI22591.1 AraC family transcriptional regulator [Fulvivirga aurantia]
MTAESIKIFPLVNKETTKTFDGYFTICWIKNSIELLEIDGVDYHDISNSIIFLNHNVKWKIIRKKDDQSAGFILYLSAEILENPLLSNLHINEVRLFTSDKKFPKITLAPGIEKRTQAILEMLDELIGSHLKNKDDAIISLLNTFFVYCDGQCNIKSVINESNSKKTIVYNYKKLIDQWYAKHHEVNDYAELLNISDKYLNECVKEVLNINAKSLITEQRVMRSRHALKFSNKTIKEIGYDLGFSSADYFSYFLKKHTGQTPSMLRKN